MLSFANVFRVLVLGVLAFHVFYMYSTARALLGGFGFELGTMFLASHFALVMLLPLVWAVTLPELPEIYVTHVRARRRWANGQCAACGYDRRSLVDATCPECGLELKPPTRYRVGLRTVMRYAVINLLAWVLGCIAAEAWMQADERSFMRSVEAQRSAGTIADVQRSRRWPNERVKMIYSADARAFSSR